MKRANILKRFFWKLTGATRTGCRCGTCVTYYVGDCKNNIGCNKCNPVGIGFNGPTDEWIATQKRLMREYPERYEGVHIPKQLLV